jgi:Domain of unknown function (DUF4359)
MKLWQIVMCGILGLCGLGLATNPDRDAYETYAIDRVGVLAKDQCDRLPAGLGSIIQGPCRAAIEAYKPRLRPLLSMTTTRQNWLLFSIYRSDIAVPAVNFNGRVESIGIFNNFFTYKTP